MPKRQTEGGPSVSSTRSFPCRRATRCDARRPPAGGNGAAPVGERVGVRHVDVEDRPARAPLGKPAEVLDLEQLGHGWRIRASSLTGLVRSIGCPMPPEKPHWAELFTEVVTSGLCTAAAPCVIACPTTSWSTTTRAGATTFHVARPGGSTTATTARRAAPCAPAPVRASQLGARDRAAPFGRERTEDEIRASPSTWCWPAPPTRGPRGRPDGVRLGSLDLGPRTRRDRCSPGFGLGGGRLHLEGAPRRGTHPRGRPRHRRLALHVLGHPMATPRRSRVALSASRWWDGCQSSAPPVMRHASRQDRPPFRPVDRAPVLQDLRRRDLPEALRGPLRAPPPRDREK